MRRRSLTRPPRQFIDRFVERLADDVPTGGFDAAQDAHQRQVGAHGIAAGVNIAPHGFDPERVGADDMAFTDVLDHGGDHMGPKVAV